MRGKWVFNLGVLVLLLLAACRSPEALAPTRSAEVAEGPSIAAPEATPAGVAATTAPATETTASPPTAPPEVESPESPAATASPLPPAETLPGVSATAPTIPSPSPTPPLPTSRGNACVPAAPPGWEAYTIQGGDTIHRLVRCSGAPAAQIATANCLLNPNLIFPGDRLFLPPGCVGAGPTAPPPPSVNPTYIDPPPPGECDDMTLAPLTGPAGTWITLTSPRFPPGQTAEVTFRPYAVATSRQWSIASRAPISAGGQIIARIPSGESDHEDVWITVVLANGTCTEAAFNLAEEIPSATPTATPPAAASPTATLPATVTLSPTPPAETPTLTPTETATTAPPSDTPAPTLPATETSVPSATPDQP